MPNFQQLALIGPTASGKSALAIKLAKKHNAYILSLDSLSIYKEINIASAKPPLEEREGVRHFGIDVIYPDEPFDVTTFINLYLNAKKEAIQDEKNLIIVGGTSFYLHILIHGISELPSISKESQEKTTTLLKNIDEAYTFLYNLDQEYLETITKNDRYRLEKMLNLYFETGIIPSLYFKKNPPIATISDPISIYEIKVDREILRQRIQLRTSKMLKDDLIDEVFYLEKNYTRLPNCMKSIGIKEVLQYLDGKYTKLQMRESIITHTAQLAKRQRTFNNSKFKNKVSLPLETLEILLLNRPYL